MVTAKTDNKKLNTTATRKVSYGKKDPGIAQGGVNVPLPKGGSLHFKKGETKEVGAEFAELLCKNIHFNQED